MPRVADMNAATTRHRQSAVLCWSYYSSRYTRWQIMCHHRTQHVQLMVQEREFTKLSRCVTRATCRLSSVWVSIVCLHVHDILYMYTWRCKLLQPDWLSYSHSTLAMLHVHVEWHFTAAGLVHVRTCNVHVCTCLSHTGSGAQQQLC